MQKLDGKSLDIVSENVEKLKEIFPEVSQAVLATALSPEQIDNFLLKYHTVLV